MRDFSPSDDLPTPEELDDAQGAPTDYWQDDDSDLDDEGDIDAAADNGLWNEDSICDF